MSAARPKFRLDRYSQIGELATNLSQIIRYIRTPLAGVLIFESVSLALLGRSGAVAFALISIGAFVPLEIWRAKGIGLPLMPLVLLQNLILYGLPIATNHETIATYTGEEVTAAGVELLVFGASLIGSWLIGMQLFNPARPICYALPEVNRSGLAGLGRLGFSLIGAATAYLLTTGVGLFDAFFHTLPSGLLPILGALYSACAVCGFFLVAMAIGSGGMGPKQQIAFTLLLAANALVSAASLLLSGPAMVLSSVAIGLFWGTGRLPWRYIVTIIALLSFLNVGKFAMREKHWVHDEYEVAAGPIALVDVPAQYVDWAQTSFALITEPAPVAADAWMAKTKTVEKQGIADRLDNLQNLLFIIHTIGFYHAEPLWGRTYTLIPALLVPRILWPDKPHTHEAQVLLNVHFGRQDLASTNTTYVAWGLLPEAYANFGPLGGAIVLGLVLGLVFAWIENFTVRKLVISVEGFIAFDILLSLMNSFEMVASIMVTSTFQSIVPITFASLPFSRQMKIERPSADPPADIPEEPPA